MDRTLACGAGDRGSNPLGGTKGAVAEDEAVGSNPIGCTKHKRDNITL